MGTAVWQSSPDGGRLVIVPDEPAWGDVAARRSTAANVADDEFNDASIDAAWVHVDNGVHVATWTESASLLSVANPADDASAEVHALVKPATIPIGTKIETAIRMLSQAQNWPIAGLIFANGSTYGAGIQVACGYSIDGLYQISERTGYNATSATQFVAADPEARLYPQLFMRLTYVAANTWRSEFSPDGVSWLNLIGDQTLSMTPSRFGVFSSGNTAAAAFVASFEYFRVS